MTDKSLFDSEKNRKHYSTVKGYNDDKNRFLEPRIRLLATWLKNLDPKRFLDVGASDGFVSQLLPEDCEYDGVELNPEAVANSYPRAKGRILQVDATTHDYKPDHYDVVWCAEILEHVPNPIALLMRLAPSLNSTGVLIATSAMGHSEREEPGNSEHLREWNLAEFGALFKKAGYEIAHLGLSEVYPGRPTNVIIAKLSKLGGTR